MDTAPMNLPELSREPYLVIDVETHDPLMRKLGTNAIHRARGGRLLGYSVYVPGGYCEYFPHAKGSPAYLWLKDQIERAQKLVGANFKYDLLWLLSEGLWHSGLAKRRAGDVLINASLLDENTKELHNLNSQALLYGLEPKKNDELYEAARTLGIAPGDVKENMHKIQEHFPEIMALYGRHDALITGKVYEAQLIELHKQLLDVPPTTRPDAMPVLEIEERILPILVLMEAQGVRVDTQYIQELGAEIDDALEAQKRIIHEVAGFPLNYNPSGVLRDYIARNWPNAVRGGKNDDIKCGDADLRPYAEQDPVIEAVLKARKLNKINSTYIHGYLTDKRVGDRLYPNIYQLAGEDEDGKSGGTITGRFSYAKPNLQNIPIRDEYWGPKVRRAFIPEEGCKLMSSDISQQEPRWAVHWAVEWNIRGAKEAAMELCANPDVDWHGAVAARLGDVKLFRPAGKVLVLARTYCSGIDVITNGLIAAGVAPEMIEPAITIFDAQYGFLKVASKAAENQACKKGYVRTWSGRKGRFDKYEPQLPFKLRGKKFAPRSKADALVEWFEGHGWAIKLYQSYKAFNKVVQGSSADQTKKAIIDGYYLYDLLPSFQVHDELVDARIDSEDKVRYYEKTMVEAVKLHVPVKVGITLGGHWHK